jgi:hypothetical protein
MSTIKFIPRIFSVLLVAIFLLAPVTSGFGYSSAGSIRSEIAQAASEPQASKSAADLPIYDDALAGGWQDWSWDTTHNFDNADPIHSGSASIAVAYTAAWGGLLFHTDTALSTSGYTAIRFWVHGGSTGSQSVNFHISYGGVSYPFTVQANTWQLVTVPLATLGNPTTLSDLFWQDGSGNSQPTYYLDDISLVGTPPGTWTAVTSPVTYTLRSVAMLSANDGWAVGYEGNYPNGTPQGSAILHWNGNAWNELGSDSSGPYLLAVTTVSDSDGWAVGGNSSNFSAIRRWNGSAWSPATYPGGGYPLRSVAMVSANDGWAVGGGGDCIQGLRMTGTFRRWDGSAWSAGSNMLDRWFNSVAMVSASDGWAVGYYCYAYWDNGIPKWDSDSLILRWNGSSWYEVGSPSYYSLNSVAMVSATDGWAVGSAGTIQHWNGSAWSWVSSPTSCNLTSVSMVSANDGWAVGGGGSACPSQPSVILRWNGDAWSEMVSPASERLNSVTMVSTDEGWAVGEAGTILHYTNSTNEYTLTITSTHGTVDRNPDQATYHEGDVVQLTATPDAGWSFANWTGGLTGSANPGSVTIHGNTSVTANYTQNEYTLTITSAHGTVDRNPDQTTYYEGDVVQLTATPNAGWTFANWIGGLTSADNPGFVTVHGNTSVTANYTQNAYTLFLPLVLR